MEVKETYNPYCPVCDGCGEDGCCSAMHCEQSPEGSYCETYLRDLKFGYFMHNLIIEKIYNEKEKYKELIEFFKEAVDTNYNKIYK